LGGSAGNSYYDDLQMGMSVFEIGLKAEEEEEEGYAAVCIDTVRERHIWSKKISINKTNAYNRENRKSNFKNS